MYDGKRLRELREGRNHSRQSLSDAIGISTAQIQRHEDGTLPSGLDILKYAKFFDVSTDYLLGVSENPTSQVTENGLDDRERNVIRLWRMGKRDQAAIAILQDGTPTEV